MRRLSRPIATRAGGIALAILAAPLAQGAAVETELAGMLRSRYPYFEYVRSFNPNAPVRIAIDPSRFPALSGRTCDLWIVPARDARTWKTDPVLADTRPAGPQAIEIGGSRIQDNTFLVAAGGELNSDAGPGLGVGYDVVVDCDRDGILGNGDLIDGYGDEAGLYAVHDTTRPGPLSVIEALHDGGAFRRQKIYYPADLASRQAVPLIVISHGWTHLYTFYDTLGRHLASYGYVVMSHENDVRNGGPPGSLSAGVTTLQNTDYLLAHQDSIAGGVLDGHLDSHRIVWIGHSTGGEGVVRAYTLLHTQSMTAEHFDANDIVLLSAIAPVAWHPSELVNPFDVNFQMFLGGADTDVSSAPIDDYVQAMALFERATGHRHLIYVQGAGHEDFHSGDSPPLSAGPSLIGKDATQQVVKGYYLPLVEWYARHNLAAIDYLTRMYDWFHPRGIPGQVVIALESKDGDAAANFMIDDFETNPELSLASSGGRVFHGGLNLDEVLMRDLDGSFDWDASQPANGMTRSRFPDERPHAAVLDWERFLPAFYQFEIIPEQRDFSDDGYLSFRACQGTRHPRTIANSSALTFSVSLIDGSGVTSSIDFSSYGRLTKPYLRTGFGAGEGWANEFSTVRIRLTDFTTNGTGVDLSNIRYVRFDFGEGFGSMQGRIGIDDIEITNPLPPQAFVLRLNRSGPTARLEWPRAARGLSYNVYRGTIPRDTLGSRGTGPAVYDHRCFERGDDQGNGPRITEDATAPPSDVAGYYYLVTVVSPAGEGTAGDSSLDLHPSAGVQLDRPIPSACLP